MSNVKEGFIKRNMVMVVMIPVLGGIHYGWSLLQKNEVLVPPEERRQLQLFDWYDYFSKRLFPSQK